MNNGAAGALLSGLSSGYMAGKQLQRFGNDMAEPAKAAPATSKTPDTNAGTAVQSFADRNPQAALGVNGMTPASQPTVSPTGAIGLAADQWQAQQQQPLPATAANKTATDNGQWSTLAGFMNQKAQGAS